MLKSTLALQKTLTACKAIDVVPSRGDRAGPNTGAS